MSQYLLSFMICKLAVRLFCDFKNVYCLIVCFRYILEWQLVEKLVKLKKQQRNNIYPLTVNVSKSTLDFSAKYLLLSYLIDLIGNSQAPAEDAVPKPYYSSFFPHVAFIDIFFSSISAFIKTFWQLVFPMYSKRYLTCCMVEVLSKTFANT